jgi:hypothetical protein
MASLPLRVWAYILVPATLVGCSATSEGGPVLGQESSAIIGGKSANGYPEAALVDVYQNGHLVGYCSGSVIAPSVALTAGHCVTYSQPTTWRVTVPFVGSQEAMASSGKVYDWVPSPTVIPNRHDVGLLFLDAPIHLPSYPKLPMSPVFGVSIANIGRIDNGQISTSSLFMGPPFAAQDATPLGYPLYYAGPPIIQDGDSGGPAVVQGSDPHIIVGVTSGAGSSIELMARTDLLSAWIAAQVQVHGGPGTTPDAGPSAHDDAGAEGGTEASAVDSGDEAGDRSTDHAMGSEWHTGGCRIGPAGIQAGGCGVAGAGLGIVLALRVIRKRGRRD